MATNNQHGHEGFLARGRRYFEARTTDLDFTSIFRMDPQHHEGTARVGLLNELPHAAFLASDEEPLFFVFLDALDGLADIPA